MSSLNNNVQRRLSSCMDICRVCMKKNTNDNSDKFYDIFVNKINSVDIHELLSTMLKIIVQPGDLKPKLICENCYNKVTEWHDMIFQAQLSQFSVTQIISYTDIDSDDHIQQAITSSPIVINASNDDDNDNSNNNPSTSSPIVINTSNDDDKDNSKNNPSTSSASIFSVSSDDDDDNLNDNPSTSSPMVISASNDDDKDNSKNNPSTSSESIFSISSDDDDKDNSNDNSSSSSVSVISASDDDDDDTDNLINNPSTSSGLLKTDKTKKIFYYIPSSSKNDTHIINNKIKAGRVFYSCIIPSCRSFYRTFKGFKIHYRRHRNVMNGVMCWKCNNTFPNMSVMRLHQIKRTCMSPGMFPCVLCSETFNDLQSLSIHKYTMHINNQPKWLCMKISK